MGTFFFGAILNFSRRKKRKTTSSQEGTNPWKAVLPIQVVSFLLPSFPFHFQGTLRELYAWLSLLRKWGEWKRYVLLLSHKLHLFSQKLLLFCWMLFLFSQKLLLFCWMLFLFSHKLLLFCWMLLLFCLMQKYILRKSGSSFFALASRRHTHHTHPCPSINQITLFKQHKQRRYAV